MAGFCVSCGKPLTGPFCNSCGAKAATPGGAPAAVPPVQAGYQPVTMPGAASPPVSPTSAQSYQPISSPRTAAPTGSGIGRILLWVGGIFLVLFMLGSAAAIYGVYWVKHKVATYASAVGGRPSDSLKVVASGDSCRLLSTAELHDILGVTIEKSAEIVDDGHPGCAYYANAQAVGQLQRQAIEFAKKQTDEVNKRPGPKPDNLPALLKNANELEGVVKTFGMSQPPPDGRIFSLTVERGVGADAWSGMRVTEAAVPGFEEVPGVGDHAMIGAFGHAFYVEKGDVIITMSTMFVPDARAKGTEIANKVIAKL